MPWMTDCLEKSIESLKTKLVRKFDKLKESVDQQAYFLAQNRMYDKQFNQQCKINFWKRRDGHLAIVFRDSGARFGSMFSSAVIKKCSMGS